MFVIKLQANKLRKAHQLQKKSPDTLKTLSIVKDEPPENGSIP